ncbi:MAG TPA: isopentenyl-diphosphate Delta-isomerase [Candidatus Binatia bacterium]|nr:isopentenyl-diphosphate Delta-isomerase [Candidatus Binatia bacterium]
MEQVILVDENDRERGILEKIAAHERGERHRAFSVFVYHPEGHLMIQQRALTKYHCGGFWANTACGHPRPGEDVLAAAHRRLQEEMGFDCVLEKQIEFTYETLPFSNGLRENEYLHVFRGTANSIPRVNAAEVNDWIWISPKTLLRDMMRDRKKYAPWLYESMARLYPAAQLSR